MVKVKTPTTPKFESSLDPIFPLPANTGLHPVPQGTGKDLFDNDTYVSAGMTYRSFFIMWEQVERRAAEAYPRYIDGPLAHVAEAWLEAVIWCRSVGHPYSEIVPISEKKARKIREKELKSAKKRARCKHEQTAKKKGKDGTKYRKCLDCGVKIASNVPSNGSERPSKGLKGMGGSQPRGKSKKKA